MIQDSESLKKEQKENVREITSSVNIPEFSKMPVILALANST